MLKSQRILAPVLSLPLFAMLQGHDPHVAAAVTLAPSTARLCRTTDVNELAQTLLPPGADASTALPQLPALEIPQQPDAVTVKQTLAVRLPEVIRLAFERSPDIKITQLQLQRSCAQLREAEAANWPTLQTNGSISHTDNGSFAPASRFYNTDAFSQVQQQTFTALGQERAIAQQQFQQQLQILQQRFQQTATQVQTNTLQQQIQQLQQRASTTATLNAILDLTPFTASSVALPLSSTTTNGGTGNGSSFDAGLTLAYSLYTGGRRDASIRAAQFQVDSSRLAIVLQLQQLRQEITSNYYDIQQSQALIGVASSALNNAQENLRITQVGEQAGIRTRYEVLQAAVSLADARQNQTQANTLFNIARRQLAQRLNLPPTVDLTLPADVTATQAGTWPLSLEASIVLALNQRIELEQTRLQRQITLQQKRIVASQKRPQVQGFASLNVADDLEDRVLGDYGYSVGVQVSLNVFDGGNVRSQLRQLDEALLILDQQFNQLKESIRLEVEQAYFNLQASATNISTAQQAITQAQEGLRLAQLRLQAGVGTTLEVTRAQADLTQAQSNLIGAILTYNRALSALELATGYASPPR